MPSPIFLDANVPICAGGGQHPLKEPCLEILRLVAERRQAFWTDAEVLQELLHRYMALRRLPLGRGVLEAFAALMRGRVEPIFAVDVERAASLADTNAGLSARDLLHYAVVTRAGSGTIVTADGGFDRRPGIERLDPADLASWRARIDA